jgi:hypothetical protein
MGIVRGSQRAFFRPNQYQPHPDVPVLYASLPHRLEVSVNIKAYPQRFYFIIFYATICPVSPHVGRLTRTL